MPNTKYEIDMANQLDNPWDDDSVLSIVGVAEDNLKSSLRISSRHKLKIKQEFCHDIPRGKKGYRRKDYDKQRNANRNVISIAHAYLIHKLVLLNPQVNGVIKVCPENSKEEKVESAFTTACNNFNTHLNDRVTLKFRKSKKINGLLVKTQKSEAHRTALKTLRNKTGYKITEDDFKELRGFIKSLYHKQEIK